MTPSELTCPACGLRMKLPANFTGRAARCPKCRVVVPVPEVLSLDDDPPPAPQNAFAFTGPSAGPSRPEYRKPAADVPPGEQWLLGVAALPVALAIKGGVVGGGIGGLAMGLNMAVARKSSWSVGARLGAMAAISGLAVAIYFEVASYLGKKFDDRPSYSVRRDDPPQQPRREEPRRDDPPPRSVERLKEGVPPPVRVKPAPTAPPGWDATPSNYPTSGPIGAGFAPRDFAERPVHHLVGEGLAKLAAGPAAATAAHYFDNQLVVGYADGSTAIWDLDKPLSLPPRAGPKFAARVDRVWLAGRTRYVVADVAGRIHAVTVAAPHKGVRAAEGPGAVRLCAFGTAALVQKTPRGFEARWLVHGVPEDETPVPPQEFGDDFCGWGLKLEPPPVNPQFLLWLHTTAAGVLPDGRITVWNHQGKTLTVEAHPKPVTAWATGPNQVVFTSLDTDGNVQIRRLPDFTIDKKLNAGVRKLVHVLSNDSGEWTLGTDAAGGVVMWEVRDGKTRTLFEGPKGTPAEPVVPLAVVWPNTFVVGRGKGVELWSPHVLERGERR